MFAENGGDDDEMSDHDEIVERIGATVDFESSDDDGDEHDDEEGGSSGAEDDGSISDAGSVLVGDEPHIVDTSTASSISQSDQVEKGRFD